MADWPRNSIFYHIYPLGLCGCPLNNDFNSRPEQRLKTIYDWIDHMKGLGVNALYLGPLFESNSHGYDTKDFFMVDRRLGTNETLKELVSALHQNGIRVVLDGVFHHTGRNFFAFEDLQKNLQHSKYREWYMNIDFNGKSPYYDNFSYDAWNGHYSLVKLNLKNDRVTEHILEAVKRWINDFKIDGLRLDAADCIDIDFLKKLSGFTKNIDPQFWLMGEVIHGDYRKWANDTVLDSTTNYECYKGLHSSLNDKNYFEIAYSLKRQSGDDGIYRDLALYNFADNHDVDRVASTLKDKANLYPLYCLIFTMPGIPSLYYGSEWGITGKKAAGHDHDLRPAIDIRSLSLSQENINLIDAIKKLSYIRNNTEVLKKGNYKQLLVSHQQFVFSRTFENHTVIVALNSSDKKTEIEINVDKKSGNIKLYDRLNNNESSEIINGKLKITLWPNWAGILMPDKF